MKKAILFSILIALFLVSCDDDDTYTGEGPIVTEELTLQDFSGIEAICFQVDDVLKAMGEDMGKPVQELRIDGGAVANNLLVQFQADISGTNVIRPTNLETTALGAAYLAGIGVGLWTIDELKEKWAIDKEFTSSMDPVLSSTKKQKWDEAVRRSKNWA